MSEVNDTKTHRGAFAVLNMWPELKLENWSEQSACASQTTAKLTTSVSKYFRGCGKWANLK